MKKNTELIKTIDSFVRGEYYCSRQPASQLYEYESIKHLAFGTNVDGRTDEFIIYNQDSDNVIETINQLNIKKDYWITVFSDEKPDHYESKGLLIKREEYLMNLNLDSCFFEKEIKDIIYIQTEEDAAYINHFFNKDVIEMEKLNDPNLYFYIGKKNGHPVCYGSYALFDKIVFLNNIFTSIAYRGKGMAKALCSKMLMDAKQMGATESVLVSSQMGHPLYQKLGFQDVSKMWVFEDKS